VPFLTFSVVADCFRSADEAPASVRVELQGDVDVLAAKLTTNTQMDAEGRLSLNAWTGKDGAERTGLNIRATHIEVLE
jgi:hypothetical protein